MFTSPVKVVKNSKRQNSAKQKISGANGGKPTRIFDFRQNQTKNDLERKLKKLQKSRSEPKIENYKEKSRKSRKSRTPILELRSNSTQNLRRFPENSQQKQLQR